MVRNTFRSVIGSAYNVSLLVFKVSWYFEPSQPQRVTSWLKTMLNPSPIYSACKSSNHKLSIKHKISHDTNLHKTNIHKHWTQTFRRISPFGITPVEKTHKVSWTIPSIYQYQILKKYKKGMDRSNKKILKYYINA